MDGEGGIEARKEKNRAIHAVRRALNDVLSFPARRAYLHFNRRADELEAGRTLAQLKHPVNLLPEMMLQVFDGDG